MNTKNLKILKMNKVYNYNKYLAYEKGKLQIEKISLDKVMKNFIVLFFCYSANQIRDNFFQFEGFIQKNKTLHMLCCQSKF